MNGKRLCGWLGACGLLVGAAWWFGVHRGAVASGSWGTNSSLASTEEAALRSVASSSSRQSVSGGVDQSAPSPADLWGEGRKIPQSREDLEELVAWMRSIGHDELLRLSNAEYRFKKSELVDMLQGLKGSWVVEALGDLAQLEDDSLIKAVLVKGLVGGFQWERVDDGRMLAVLDPLLSHYERVTDDPYNVGTGLVLTGWSACIRQGEDFAEFVAGHLEGSDNPALLLEGYLMIGQRPGADSILKTMLLEHPSNEGRMGALEGLREAGDQGRIPSSEIAALGLAALETETNERNRVLLYEMMVASGGEEGLLAIEKIVRAGDSDDLVQAAGMLAMRMDPDQACALFQEKLADEGLDAEARGALYRALGLTNGDEGATFLLDLAVDPNVAAEERLVGLRALRTREVDEQLARELTRIFTEEEDSQLRSEALEQLVYGGAEESEVDLREIGVLDDDPQLRSKAVMLAAIEPSEDVRGWLEERLLEDDSYDVKASALGGLVLHAHYGGDGDAVLGYLDRARKFTDDESTLALLDQGREMVTGYDSRNLDLRLAQDAKFWTTISRYTEGSARRSFERQGQILSRMVETLRGTGR